MDSHIKFNMVSTGLPVESNMEVCKEMRQQVCTALRPLSPTFHRMTFRAEFNTVIHREACLKICTVLRL
jgi:hypothetical protein